MSRSDSAPHSPPTRALSATATQLLHEIIQPADRLCAHVPGRSDVLPPFFVSGHTAHATLEMGLQQSLRYCGEPSLRVASDLHQVRVAARAAFDSQRASTSLVGSRPSIGLLAGGVRKQKGSNNSDENEKLL